MTIGKLKFTGNLKEYMGTVPFPAYIVLFSIGVFMPWFIYRNIKYFVAHIEIATLEKNVDILTY